MANDPSLHLCQVQTPQGSSGQHRAYVVSQRGIGGQIVLEVGTNGAAVGDPEVIGLQSTLDQQFPVGFDIEIGSCHDPKLAGRQPVQVPANGLQGSQRVKQRVALKYHPDEAPALLTDQRVKL